MNTWVDPAPSPRRCYQVGELIRAVAENSQERVAILATGGLSHFPGSPRIGEIDETFDHQLLEVMRQGKGKSLVDYSVQDLLQAGDTEFLNWMVVIGAVGDAKAIVHRLHAGLCRHGLGIRQLEVLVSCYSFEPSAIRSQDERSRLSKLAQRF